MKVEKVTPNEYIVTDENLMLRQVLVKHERYNDVAKKIGDTWEFISPFSDEAKPLFIALHNFKINEL